MPPLVDAAVCAALAESRKRSAGAAEPTILVTGSFRSIKTLLEEGTICAEAEQALRLLVESHCNVEGGLQ
jgi:hypothetical protein